MSIDTAEWKRRKLLREQDVLDAARKWYKEHADDALIRALSDSECSLYNAVNALVYVEHVMKETPNDHRNQ